MNVEMPTSVGILKFMSMIIYINGWVKDENEFYKFGASLHIHFWQTAC